MALDDYKKTLWAPTMPITEDRMNKLEEGVYVNREALQELNTSVSANTTAIDRAATKQELQDLSTSLSTAMALNATSGQRAMTELRKVITLDPSTQETTYGLDNMKADLEGAISVLSQTFGTKTETVDNTSEVRTVPAYNSTNTVYKAIENLISAIGRDSQGNLVYSYNSNPAYNNTVFKNISALQSDFNNARGTSESVAQRLENMTLETIRVKDKAEFAQTQIQNAMRTDLVDENQQPISDSLAKRFNDIVSLLTTDGTSIDAIQQEIKEARLNNDSTLDARFDAIDGGSAPSRTLPNVISEISAGRGAYDTLNARFNADETNINHKVDKDNIYNDLNYIPAQDATDNKVLDARQGKVLKDLIDSIDAVYKEADTVLDNRLAAIETEISDARPQVGTDEESGEPIYGTLDNRLDSIESTATQIRNDINTIADELAMVDETTHSIKDNGTKIDIIMGEIDAAHRTVEEGEPEDTLNARFTDLEAKISHPAENEDAGGLTERLTSLEGEVRHESTGLAATKAIADANATAISHTVGANGQDDKGGLVERVTILEKEPKSATVIEATLPETGDPNKDYLIGPNDDGKYFYYKWINNDWHLISGGGSGEGTSSAQILATLPALENADANVDYYIGNSTDGYIHYRYIPSDIEDEDGTFEKILPNSLINNLGVTTITTTSAYTDTDAWPTSTIISGGLEAYTLSDSSHTTNLLNDFVAVRNARINATYSEGSNIPTSQTLQILDTKGHIIEYPIVGGSGGGSAYSIRFLSTLPNNTFTVPQDSSYHTLIKAKAIIKQGNTTLDGVSFSGEVLYQLSTDSAETWHKSNITVGSITNDKEFSIDVSSILQSNSTTKVRLSVDINTGDGAPVNRYIDYNITKTAISISSTFNPSTILKNANLIIHYTCQGVNLDKLVYFKVDGENIIDPISTNSHNVEEEAAISLRDLSQGSHTLQIYFTTGGNIQSNKLNYYFIYNLDDTQETPIIGANVANDNIIDGEELVINYTVYTPGKETTEKVEAELYVIDNNGNATSYDNNIYSLTNIPVERSQWKTVKYPTPITPAAGQSEVPVKVRVKLTAYNTVIKTNENQEPVEVVYTAVKYIDATINRFTNPNNYNFTEVATRNLLYDYTAYGKSNNDIDRENYTYEYTANDVNSTKITFNGTFTGFNWATNGYVDGESLTISGGAKYHIDVPIFAQSYNIGTEEAPQMISIESQTAEDITQYGRTIEIDYEVRSATDLNATIIKCIDPSTHAGFCITPNYCYLTNKTKPAEIDEQDGFILNESSIAAAYLQTNTRIHLAFVIEPWSLSKAFDKTFHQSVNIYINGEFANSCPYERDSDGRILDSFTSNATMTLGSDTCILKIYGIKIYNRGLDHDQILQTYKLAPSTLYDRLTRFEDNDVLTNNRIDYKKARLRFNCLLLKGPDPTAADTLNWPTISPYKGSPSPARRKKKASDTDYEGKTESGLILTKPSSDPTTAGYVEEFNLCDKVPVGAPAYLGAAGAYCSSNNVQGTSSQKYPLHNLKIYLAKWQKEKTSIKNVALEEGEEVPEGTETVEIDGITYKVVTETTPAQIKKVKYSIKGYDNAGNPLGTEESTLCWKADYMSTDHANTYNANIADGLFSSELQPNWKDKKLQNTVYGIRCMLFVQQGDDENSITFVGDGCLNNDKGNTKTFGLDDADDNGNDTLRQRWEFTNNTYPLDVFKSDNLFAINEKDSKKKIFAKGAFECNYPDEGDLEDEGLQPNYNHLQILLTWVNKRACYLDYSVYDDVDGSHIDYTVSDTPIGVNESEEKYRYNGINYPTEREMKKAIFKNEFEDHFNLNHVLTYYLLSEYIALCDNRAKNMFIRSEDIRSEVIYNTNGQKILDGNSYPDDGTLWNAFVNTSTGITTPSVINWNTTGENHSTFAKWAPVLYDLDSCFGVENVGLITIKYNADWQYKYNNKEAFSGFDSVFWLMVEDTYANELRTLATQLYNNELNFTNFYRQQIAGNRNATCPAITNYDMILKYQKPWNEGFINYAETPDPVTGKYPEQTPLYKYIQRGTRTTQKTTFMRQRSMLLSSKYVSYEFTNSMISFRAGVPVTGENTLLTLVANQDLYPAIMFGDSNTLIRPTKMIVNNAAVDIVNDYVPAGTPFQISTSQIGNSDTVKIVGASVLNDIGDLSKYQPYELKVGSGTNLKRLIIGSDVEGYINTSTETIEGLSDCVLLEEINIQNTTKLTSLNLSGNGLIKKVYAKGSNATTITLPNGGVLEEIEYGAKTTNITLLNQKFLNTFTFEGNTYNSLQKLWVENTPNVPIVDIINTRIKDLVNGIRLIGIDIDLDNDATFLEKITSKLAIGKYITSSGIMPSNNQNYPTITGRVKIHTIRKSLFNLLKKHYPNLEIDYDYDGLIDEYTIKYVDWDGSLLYTLNGTATEYYIDPAVDINPITNEPYIPWPKRDPSAEYYYYFGSYNSNQEYTKANYEKFSGWIIEYNNDTKTQLTSKQIEGNQVKQIRATYDTTVQRKYKVSWYKTVNDETPITSVERPYGTDISSAVEWPDENGTLPRGEFVNQTYYRVFTGWDSPGGELTGDMRINAQWQTSNISPATPASDFDLSNLTAADLYALGQVTPATRSILLPSSLSPEKTIMLKMGHDFNFNNNITTYNLLENNTEITFNGGENAITFNGTNHHAIYPFQKVLNPLTNEYEYQDFTLALDYQITANTALTEDEYVLASCFSAENSVKSGFKLSLRPDQVNNNFEPIIFTWGSDELHEADTYRIVDYRKITNDSAQYSKNYRNMIVIAFSKKTPNKITIYYSSHNANSPDYYGDTIDSTTLTYDSVLDQNISLVLGQSANYKLYWGKFWQTNIGMKNCVKLANWPHETIPCYLTGYEGASTEVTNPRVLDETKLTFVTAEIVGDRLYQTSANLFNGINPIGWHSSPIKTFYNERIYEGLSTEYQSVIAATKIKSNSSRNLNTNNVEYFTTSDNYLFQPSEREINPEVSSSEALKSWSWLTTSIFDKNTNKYLLKVYKFRTNSQVLERQEALSNLNLYRCRFKDYHLSQDTNVFITTQTPYNNGNSWSIYNSSDTVTLSDGDIWMQVSTDGQIQNVYTYVSRTKVNAGAYIDVAITRSNGLADGGWRQGDYWQTRTYDTNMNTSNPQWRYFNQVNKLGGIDIGGQMSSTEYGSYKGIIFEFAI